MHYHTTEKPTFYVYLLDEDKEELLGKVIDEENDKGYIFTIMDENDKFIYKIIDKHLLKEVSWTQALTEDMK